MTRRHGGPADWAEQELAETREALARQTALVNQLREQLAAHQRAAEQSARAIERLEQLLAQRS